MNKNLKKCRRNQVFLFSSWFWIIFDIFFYLNKWLPYRSSFCFLLFLDFAIWVRHLFSSSSWCNVVCFLVLSWCTFGSHWQINFDQLQIQSMIWASTLQIWRHEYWDDFDFFIFVDIFPFYVNQCCEFVHRFIFFDFNNIEFVSFWYILPIWLNEWISTLVKKNWIKSLTRY